ncbi:amphi-Trp domain-containing protein [Calidifontibacillus erzurumensis]|uniref:Amphi-Trp domain-containing protein n=1 Tax=Calidifontibacillus erzurumensis TaxID=2741433 RepID=A0A8J8GIR5_9BACI|nr:amphi-Trp domain-containing protein [Calidifontibacillus erzurumensis]NSL52501.1 amphi-Trp domain-containing protein [Calidifontibacillus erzurumensis]
MNEMTKPATQVLLKHKEQLSPMDFAAMLEKVAQKLKEEGKFTIVQGEEQVIVQPTGQIKVEFKYTQKGDKHSFEIEFDWYEGEQAPKSMTIE